MRICVFGAGAVGGHLAARLGQAGHDVSIIARGEHLDAIGANGITLLAGEERLCVQVRAVPDASLLEPQDAVLITVKSTSFPGLPTAIAPLIGGRTALVFAQNGIPWWYGIDAPAADASIPHLSWMDPDGALAELKPRVLGGVIYSANEVVLPGVVRNHSVSRNQLLLGELNDSDTSRVQELRAALEKAKIRSPAVPAIREAVWSKLVANMSSSLLAAVTGTPTAELRANPAFETIFRRLHAEACTIASASVPMFASPSPVKAQVGHKPSILQDYERGRPMEIEGLAIAPLEFARAAGVNTPTLDLLAVLLVEKAERAGLYKSARPLPIAA